VTQTDIREEILRVLYDFNREHSPSAMKASHLKKQVGLDERAFKWNINYLIENRLVKHLQQTEKVQKAKETGHIGFSWATDERTPRNRNKTKTVSLFRITSKGISLIENSAEQEEKTASLRTDADVSRFLDGIRQALGESDLSEKEKRLCLEAVEEVLANPLITPFVEGALLKLLNGK
jgi:predicted transcriptional regulator